MIEIRMSQETIPDNNLPVYFQKYKVEILDSKDNKTKTGSITYTTVGAIPSNLKNERVFRISLCFNNTTFLQIGVSEKDKVSREKCFGKRETVNFLSFRLNVGKSDKNLMNNAYAGQKLSIVSPFVGVNYRNFVFSYNYTFSLSKENYLPLGIHQFSLGYNLFVFN